MSSRSPWRRRLRGADACGRDSDRGANGRYCLGAEEPECEPGQADHNFREDEPESTIHDRCIAPNTRCKTLRWRIEMRSTGARTGTRSRLR